MGGRVFLLGEIGIYFLPKSFRSLGIVIISRAAAGTGGIQAVDTFENRFEIYEIEWGTWNK